MHAHAISYTRSHEKESGRKSKIAPHSNMGGVSDKYEQRLLRRSVQYDVPVRVVCGPRPSFIPGGRAPRREQSPAAMIPFTKTHGLYVGDDIDGECQPVFLTTGRALDR
jgi:hypothetical protein